MCEQVVDKFIILDCPEPNQHALDFVERLNFKASFETARMYTNTLPDTNLSKVFGISSFELG
ncbi:hypothetical protein L3V82_05130 [Thiotrichales bacterium 19S3-7]|nr:hypothetical protein [Thiotrichales bacterium 19S3-7]MCF6801475.1 hypothetical protein [Thiotrichales bacterium 19S3-11]